MRATVIGEVGANELYCGLILHTFHNIVLVTQDGGLKKKKKKKGEGERGER